MGILTLLFSCLLAVTSLVRYHKLNPAFKLLGLYLVFHRFSHGDFCYQFSVFTAL
jgi:hypothetical protein